jgi:hypothetical protein
MPGLDLTAIAVVSPFKHPLTGVLWQDAGGAVRTETAARARALPGRRWQGGHRPSVSGQPGPGP